MLETCVRSLGWKIPWRRAWQPTPVFLLGESPWIVKPGRLQSMGSQRVRHDCGTKHPAHTPSCSPSERLRKKEQQSVGLGRPSCTLLRSPELRALTRVQCSDQGWHLLSAEEPVHTGKCRVRLSGLKSKLHLTSRPCCLTRVGAQPSSS